MLKITIILMLAFALRLFGINWDQGAHLHPDERMLLMVADKLHFFDKLNPEFFNYGSLPIYLLRGSAQILDTVFGLQIGNYDGMLYLGRLLSTVADLGTIYFIYLIARKLFKDERAALISAFFYAIAFFPIQNSHFFIVDTFLTFFLTALVYSSLLYLEKPTWKKTVFLAITLAAAVTTKITAIIFLPVIFALLLLRTVILASGMRPESSKVKADSGQARMTVTNFFLFMSSFLVFSFVFMPYAFLNWSTFLKDVSLQIKLNSDAYIFPYTLQYVGTVPYLYYLQNIFWWGLGPILSLLALLGLFYILKIKPVKKLVLLYLLFNLFYFLVIGRSTVKFMRYMLPLYPFFALMAGYRVWRLTKGKETGKKTVLLLILFASSIWAVIFLNIYSIQHPRITATNWILQNIPSGSKLAVEHWDDALPLTGSEKYNLIELPLYDQPDGQQKWEALDNKLAQSDYVIISSNRLYVPLQKLTNCEKFKICYPRAADYYKKLFNGELGFEKVAEFSVYPGLQIANWKIEIPDDLADESFTVYDHPKVIILKKSLD